MGKLTQLVKIVTYHKKKKRKAAADLFVKEGVAAVGWPVVGDLAGKSMEQIETILINERDYSKSRAANAAWQLIGLRDRVMRENVIFAYQCDNIVARVGTVIREYKFNGSNTLGDPQGDFKYPQQVRVEWRDKPRDFDRRSLPGLKDWLARRGTIAFRDYDRDALDSALRKIS